MEFELWQYALLFLAAFSGGFIDAIAGGGGLICLPALIAVGVPADVALATNKFQGSFGTFTAALNFVVKKLVNLKEIWLAILFIFIGAFIGTTTVASLDPSFLSYLVPFMLGAILLYTLFSPSLGEVEKNPLLKPMIFYISFGFLLGFYDGFFGPGTGSFWTFAIVGILGYSIKKAVGQAKVLNFISNIVSLIAFFMAGVEILWVAGVVMAVGQIAGGFTGSNMVMKMEAKVIKRLFLTVVGFMIIALFIKAFK